jgi:hypothetical protein
MNIKNNLITAGATPNTAVYHGFRPAYIAPNGALIFVISKSFGFGRLVKIGNIAYKDTEFNPFFIFPEPVPTDLQNACSQSVKGYRAYFGDLATGGNWIRFSEKGELEICKWENGLPMTWHPHSF